MREAARRIAAGALGVGTLVLAVTPALAQQGQGMYGPGGMYGGWHGPGTWWGPFMGILMMAAVVGVVVGGILLLRHFWHVGERPGGDSGGDSGGAAGARPRAILDERYARGEIDREEYLQRRRDLEGKGS